MAEVEVTEASWPDSANGSKYGFSPRGIIESLENVEAVQISGIDPENHASVRSIIYGAAKQLNKEVQVHIDESSIIFVRLKPNV